MVVTLAAAAMMTGLMASPAAATINTFAGNGTTAYTGDGGPATSAGLSGPQSVAIDGQGNVYIVDEGHSVVRMVDTQGNIWTFAGNSTNTNKCGNGPAVGVGLDDPRGVGVDGAGNVYIADYLCGAVFKVSAGILTTVAGNLNTPTGVAIDSAGNVYIAQPNDNMVRMVDTHGTVTPFAGNGTPAYTGDGGLAINASLKAPTGVAIDADGNVYIADMLNNVVREVDTHGTITTFAGNGMPGYTGDGGTATSAKLNQPQGVTVDHSGYVYVADTGNNVVRKVGRSPFALFTWPPIWFPPIIWTVAGNGSPGFSGDGGSETNATLQGPVGIAVIGPPRWLGRTTSYIADTVNNRVRVVSVPGFNLLSFILIVILIGLVASALAGRVVSGHRYGVLGDIVVGVFGAVLGGWAFAAVFGIVAGRFVGSLAAAFVGAVILLWLIRRVAARRG